MGILMRSAEVPMGAIQDIPLSQDHRLVGRLPIQGVQGMWENGEKIDRKIQIPFPDNDWLHVKIQDHGVFCEIGWRGHSSSEVDFSDFEIHATTIWWENIPNGIT